MADQGASQARTNEVAFDRSSSFQGNDGGVALVSRSVTSSASFQGNDDSSQQTREVTVGVTFTGGDRAGAARSNASVPRSKRDGLVRTYILRRFLGWDGGTPVRWTSAINQPPQPGLTNITVEDEFLVRVPVGGRVR